MSNVRGHFSPRIHLRQLNDQDLYAALGVLPSADEVVIRAAFKALAQRYHPDKWPGSSAEANQRMAKINEAYRILGDPTLRKEYDKTRASTSSNDSFNEGQDAQNEAFSSALQSAEERWEIACSVYPNLQDYRSQLARISTSLAFAYVTTMLEEKLYSRREAIAKELEHGFLERYFGTNPRILGFARNLILLGKRDAAKDLNKLVDVLGSDVDPDLLIQKVEQKHGAKTSEAAPKETRSSRQDLVKAVKAYGYYREARELAELHGYMTTEVGGGLLSSPQVHVKSRTGNGETFKNATDFVAWVKANLCH